MLLSLLKLLNAQENHGQDDKYQSIFLAQEKEHELRGTTLVQSHFQAYVKSLRGQRPHSIHLHKLST